MKTITGNKLSLENYWSIRNPFCRHRLRNTSPSEDFYFEGDGTRERRRLGSVTPDETANRAGWGPRVCADEVCDKLIRGISLTRQGVALGNSPQKNDHQSLLVHWTRASIFTERN